MPTINEMVPDVDLACKKHPETICHTINTKKQLKRFFVHSLQIHCNVVHPGCVPENIISVGQRLIAV